MPNYGSGTNGTPVALQPGDSHKLFDAEEPSAPQASQAICRAAAPGTGVPAGIVFTTHFAEAPTAVVEVQGANVNDDDHYQTLWTSTDTQDDYYHDQGNFAFYRARLASQTAGAALTVIAQR